MEHEETRIYCLDQIHQLTKEYEDAIAPYVAILMRINALEKPVLYGVELTPHQVASYPPDDGANDRANCGKHQ